MMSYGHRYEVLYCTVDKKQEEVFSMKDYQILPIYIDSYAEARITVETIKALVPDVKRIQIDYAIYSYSNSEEELQDITTLNMFALKDGEWIEVDN